MGRFRIEIASDGMAAALEVAPGPAATAEQLRQELRHAGIVFGLDAPVLATLELAVTDPAHASRTLIARGEAPQAGCDGHVELHAPLGLLPGSPLADDTIDFRERNLLQPVSSGAVCATVIAPTAGAPGRDVLGRARQPTAGREARFTIGAGLRREGAKLIAARSGALVAERGAFDVVPLFTHGGDVDYHSGNLHTEGALVVRGDVRPGFEATATEALHVFGAVLDGTVRCGGAARIEQGVLGQRSMVAAATDIWCHHATAATLHAGGRITLADGASHCRAKALAIVATGGRGIVFGGELRARECISIRTAGRERSDRTLLAVADTSDAGAAFVRSSNLEQKLADRARQLAKGNGPRCGKSQRRATKIDDMTRWEALRLRQQQRALLNLARIEVLGTLHEGVCVRFGDRQHTIVKNCERVRLRWDVERDRLLEERLT